MLRMASWCWRHVSRDPENCHDLRTGQADQPLLRLKARRFFWLNGRYDVQELPSGKVLATLRRMGAIERPDRTLLGRVVDPTPPKKHFLQALFIGVMDLIFGGGDSGGNLSVDQYRIEINRIEVATVRRTKLPFPSAAAEEPAHQAGPRHWLQRWRKSILKRLEAGGWVLDFTPNRGTGVDWRILLAAALLRIHIEDRYR